MDHSNSPCLKLKHETSEDVKKSDERSDRLIHRRQFEETFFKLVRKAGAQSTAIIFTAVTNCWQGLRRLESLCPVWASYSGTTSLPNMFFHRHQLQFGPSLISIFSYHALLDEIEDSIEYHKKEKILDVLVLLDGMRCRFQSMPSHQKSMYDNRNDSDNVSTTSESSGFSRVISEDEDEIMTNENLSIENLVGHNGTTKPQLPEYVPMSRNELRNGLKLISLAGSPMKSHTISAEMSGTISSSSGTTEIVGPVLFDRAVETLLEVAETADLRETSVGSNIAEVATQQATEEGTVLMKLLDEIRQALEVPSNHDDRRSETMSTNVLNSETKYDRDAFMLFELVNCLNKMPENYSDLQEDGEFSSPRVKRRASQLSLTKTTGKRRKVNSPLSVASEALLSPTSSSSDQPSYSSTDLATPCPGVCWDPTHQRWVAHWSDSKTHQRIRKYFNPKLLGFERSRLLAILTRKEAVDSGRASMMVKADRPKLEPSEYCHSSSDDPFDQNYLKGVYFSTSDDTWYAHWKSQDAVEIEVEGFPVSTYLSQVDGDVNAAMSVARAKAVQCRQESMAQTFLQSDQHRSLTGVVVLSGRSNSSSSESYESELMKGQQIEHKSPQIGNMRRQFVSTVGPVGQRAVGHQPVPVGQQSFGQQPVGQRPLGEQPAERQPMGQQLVVGQQPVGQQLVVGQQPVGQQPVGQQPVGQQPVGQQPVGQQPVGQQPVGQQPVGQQPVGQQPVGQQPVGEQPVGGQSVGQQPVGQRPVGQRPLGEQSSQQQPHVVQQPSTGQQLRGKPLPYRRPVNGFSQFWIPAIITPDHNSAPID